MNRKLPISSPHSLKLWLPIFLVAYMLLGVSISLFPNLTNSLNLETIEFAKCCESETEEKEKTDSESQEYLLVGFEYAHGHNGALMELYRPEGGWLSPFSEIPTPPPEYVDSKI